MAGLLVLALPAVVVPILGPVYDETVTPDQPETTTLTPPLVNDTETNTDESMDNVPPTATPPEMTERGNNTTLTVQAQKTLSRELLAIRNDSQSQRVTALNGADAVLASRQEVVGSGRLNQSVAAKLSTQRTNVRGARALLTISESGNYQENLTTAVSLATVGMKLQVAQVNPAKQPTDPNNVTLPSSPMPAHDSPSSAAFALLDQYNVTPTTEQAANIRALDDLPKSKRRALTDYLDAYLGYYLATKQASMEMNRTRLGSMMRDAEALRQVRENRPVPPPLIACCSPQN